MRPSIGIGELMVASCVTILLSYSLLQPSCRTHLQAELTRLLPNEVGAAAAYEAWRQYRHTLSHYDYLNPYDRRQEAMHGLAVAEGEFFLHRGFHLANSSIL